jgi:hypothetical protein
MGAILDMWAGSWWATAPPSAGDAIKDVNGVTITLGATIKMVGLVTAINTTDPHFGTIQVTPIHPNGWPAQPIEVRVFPQSSNFRTPNAQLPQGAYGYEPLQLVVGS